MTPPSDDKAQLDITVVITCYNEAQYIVDTIEAVVMALAHTGLAYEVIVIDDASKDNSVDCVRQYIAGRPSCRVVLHHNQVNRGLAANYVDGAFLGKGKYYHLTCGDNCYPVDQLERIYRLVGKADMIVPYQLQRDVIGKTLARRVISWLFTRTVNLLTGYPIKYYNGLTVQLRHNVLRWHTASYGFGYQAETLTMLLEQGASYVQVRVRSVDRKGTASSAPTLRNVLSVCHTLLEIAIRRVRRILYGKNWPRPVEIKLPGLDDLPPPT